MKSIYGLHQTGRCWYNDLHSKWIENGFRDTWLTCIYSYKNKAVIVVYVDDLPIFARNDKVLKEVVVTWMQTIYEVKNLWPVSVLLEILKWNIMKWFI